ncbi:trihydrophobin-like [Aphidius gifuensis]|uniref:trihydrophobin-like n=1 Tax=Aphidius gifuensis TaxID=684658 RepID=UPI001CDBFCEA|nr:trihydrophobin-like [Aphidius gifuensis]
MKIGNYVRPQQSYASPTCRLCGIRGHAARNCGMQRENQQRPQVRFNEKPTPMWNQRPTCQLCNIIGHQAKDCNQRRRSNNGYNNGTNNGYNNGYNNGNNGRYYNGNKNGYNNNYTNGYNNGNNMGNNNGNMVGNKYADNRKDGSIRGCDFCKGDDHIEMNCVEKTFQQRVQGNLQPSL